MPSNKSNNDEASYSLGVLEFCAALNSQEALTNAHHTLTILQKFVQTVHRERAIALSQNQSQSQSQNDVNHNMNRLLQLNQQQQKQKQQKSREEEAKAKAKKSSSSYSRSYSRSWMEDTKDYNVPFVGTAMVKGSTGVIVPNTWPCGLLKEYLTTSPVLSEMMGLLTHSDFGKGWHNADQICIVRAAFYCAVAALLLLSLLSLCKVFYHG